MSDKVRSEEELCNEVVHRTHRGESKRRIGMQLGISRWKVTEILRRYHLGRQADQIPEAQPNDDSLPQAKTHEPIPPSLGRPAAKRASKLDAFEPQLRQLIERYPNITIVRLYEELQTSGYSGRYSILAERVRQLRDRPTKPLTVRFETGPGVQAQMDWSTYEIDFTQEGIEQESWRQIQRRIKQPPIATPPTAILATARPAKPENWTNSRSESTRSCQHAATRSPGTSLFAL